MTVTASVTPGGPGLLWSAIHRVQRAIFPSHNARGLSFNVGSKGQDASLTVDGVPVDSSSNTIANAIAGVTLNLMGTTSSPVTLQVSPEFDTFVSDYNTIISNLNSQFTSRRSSSGTTGTLMGDSAAEFVQHVLGDTSPRCLG